MAAPTFRCTIGGRNVRIFGASVAFLQKMGNDITLDCSTGGVRPELSHNTQYATTMAPPSTNEERRVIDLLTLQIIMRALNDAKTTFASIELRPGA